MKYDSPHSILKSQIEAFEWKYEIMWRIQLSTGIVLVVNVLKKTFAVLRRFFKVLKCISSTLNVDTLLPFQSFTLLFCSHCQQMNAPPYPHQSWPHGHSLHSSPTWSFSASFGEAGMWFMCLKLHSTPHLSLTERPYNSLSQHACLWTLQKRDFVWPFFFEVLVLSSQIYFAINITFIGVMC